MVEKNGTIVEYFEGDVLQLACVVDGSKSRLKTVTQEGRTQVLPEKRIVLRHGAAPPESDKRRALTRLLDEILEKEAEVDTELLWEHLLEAPSFQGLSGLAQLYFGNTTPSHQSGLLRALVKDRIRFERNGLSFAARTKEDIAAVEAAHIEKERREEFRAAAEDWLSSVSGKQTDLIDVPEGLEQVVEDLFDFLQSRKRSLSSDILEQQAGDRPTAEVAFEVLLRTGRIKAEADTWLLMAGIQPGFGSEIEEAAEAMAAFEGEEGRRDFSSVLSFTIDAAESGDLDDAISLEVRQDSLHVSIHIADVAHYVKPGDLLDEEAARRGFSVYLPTRVEPMFPERLSKDLASLRAGVCRPTLSFSFVFDKDGNLQTWEVNQGQIIVRHRLTYEAVDQMIAGDAVDGLSLALRRLYDLTLLLQRQRLNQGALVLQQPETHVTVNGDDIQVTVVQQDTPAHNLVGELMVLVNHTAARLASEKELPFLYKMQPPPDNPALVGVVLPYDPVQLVTQLRGLKRSRLSSHPLPHAGLGLEAYTQVTSPIRRYGDLVLHRQLMAHLAGEIPPASVQDLLSTLETVEQTDRVARALQRRVTNYWVLQYLGGLSEDESLEALVLKREGGGYLVELPALAQRGLLVTTRALEPGMVLQVMVKEVRPLRGFLRLEEVEEV